MEADMADPLITKTQLAQLIANGARNAAGEDIDPRPVVKLLRPTLARLGCSLKPIPTNQTTCASTRREPRSTPLPYDDPTFPLL